MSRAAVALLVAAAVPGCAAGAAPSGDAAWRLDPVWDDGKAEFCVYELDWARYGRLNPGRSVTILVKEPWAPDLDVKADRPRPDGFEVLKLNHLRDVPTGIYTYHQMASVFLRRDDAALVKIAATSSEGCGISTAQMRDGRLETHSYFDGIGDRTVAWQAGSLPEDGLPALLRDFVAGEPPRTLRIVPSLMDSRLDDVAPREATLERLGPQTVEVPAGRFEGVELRLTTTDGVRSYWFEAASPHRLLRSGSSDGSESRLARCERLAYWTLNGPGGEDWIPERLR